MAIKINLGSHNKIIGEDFINIDILDLKNVDAICDIFEIPFKLRIKNSKKFISSDWDLFDNQLSGNDRVSIGDSIVDEIIMDEVLEHISFRKTTSILKEIYRILKPRGILKLQVPDCGRAMQAWIDKKVCHCVPHKPIDEKGFVGNSNCKLCRGEAIMDWERWLFSFVGAQKHFPHDIHKAIFTREILATELCKINFRSVIFFNHPVKLKVEAIK